MSGSSIPVVLTKSLQDYKVTPWKNGGGVTTELAIYPPGASVSTNFDWRVSSAVVGSSGPFSFFPNCDRTLLILQGPGMVIDHSTNGSQTMNEQFAPIKFSGDWTTSGTLLGTGSCTDFNVISNRTACKHTLNIVKLDTSATSFTSSAVAHPPPRRWILVVCAEGTAEATLKLRGETCWTGILGQMGMCMITLEGSEQSGDILVTAKSISGPTATLIHVSIETLP
ncbi:HutD family protein [Pelomyxa schiedti]|nr:HutD family protein [Pelomyxa schiedti]